MISFDLRNDYLIGKLNTYYQEYKIVEWNDYSYSLV
jgi:hypothetical protein